jgi:hypothetical protein
MNLDGINMDIFDGIVVATAIGTQCSSPEEQHAVLQWATDSKRVEADGRGTPFEGVVCRAFSLMADEIGCLAEIISLFLNFGIAHSLIDASIANHILLVHVRNGYVITKPGGEKLTGVMPDGETVKL